MKKVLRLLIIVLLGIFLFACQEKTSGINNDKVNEVIDLIEFLPNKVSLDDEEDVNHALSLYNALNENEKKLVSNYEVLEYAKSRIDYYKNEPEEILKIVAKAKAYLEATVPNFVDYQTAKIELPSYYEGSNEFDKYVINFSWQSSNPKTIDIAGNVNHDINDVKVTLTAKLTTRKLSNLEDFTIEVNVGHTSFKPLNKGKIISGYIYNNYPTFSKSDLATLDIVYVCFGQIVERNGEFSITTSGISFLNEISEVRNSGIRLVLSLGGWRDNSDDWIPYQNAAKTEEGRTQVANSILETLKTYHLDGIDMDWEYPRRADRTNYKLLMEKIRDTLKAESSEYIISAAIPAGSWLDDSYDLKSLNNILDYFNVMSYDLDDGRKTSHLTALYNSTYASTSADSGMSYLVSKGVSKSKIIIGAAFYGRKFEGVENTNHGLGQSYTKKSSITFKEIKERYLNRLDYDVFRYYDSTAHAYYLYDTKNQVFISYDDPEAIKEKCDYVIKNGYGGIMYWSYTDDLSGTLMDALGEKLKDMKK